MSTNPIRVTVWGENLHEQKHEAVRAIYPDGMHTVIAAGIKENLGEAVQVRTATLDQPEHGLTDDVLAETDVMTWWGHMGHHLVDDAVVKRVHERVLSGMGLVVLHSGHWSKLFVKLMGTSCTLRYREAGDREIVQSVFPGHPITENVPPVFVIPEQEMYGEPFDIPPPQELVFVSSFLPGGEVFRSGGCWTRGSGRIFYFSPGHETHPVYYQPEVRQVIANGVRWAFQEPKPRQTLTTCVNSPHGWYEKREEA